MEILSHKFINQTLSNTGNITQLSHNYVDPQVSYRDPIACLHTNVASSALALRISGEGSFTSDIFAYRGATFQSSPVNLLPVPSDEDTINTPSFAAFFGSQSEVCVAVSPGNNDFVEITTLRPHYYANINTS